MPVLRTPFWGDDEPNSQRAATLSYFQLRALRYVWNSTSDWIRSEGRFFPVSAFENVFIFTNVGSRWSYKLISVAAVVMCALAVGWLFRLLVNARGMMLLGVMCFVASVQVRHWYDPTIGFGLLLPSVTFKFVLVFCLALKMLHLANYRWRHLLGALAALLWTSAVLQYEAVFFVYPVILATVLSFRNVEISRRIGALMWTLVPTMSTVLLALVLRSRVVPSEGYRVNFEVVPVLSTLAKQIVAALPLSSTMLMNQSAWSAWSIPIVISSAIPIFAVMWTRWASDADVQLTTSRRPVLVGIAMVVCGALPAAVSVKWQTQLFWGTGYLFVFIQFVGTALLISGLAVGLGAQVQSVGRLGRTSVLALVALAIAGMGGIHAAGIEDVAWRTEPIAWKRELYEANVRDGFFADIPTGASIISSSYNPNGWVNPWYYQWLGGSRTHRLSGTVNGMVAACTEAEKDGRCSLAGPWWGFAELQAGPRETVDVLGLYVRLDTDSVTTEMAAGTVRLSARKYELLPLNCRENLEKTKSGNWTGSCGQDVRTFAQVQALLNSE